MKSIWPALWWIGVFASARLGASAQDALRSQPAPPATPNIVVIVADDLGYADLGCQGAGDVRTPNIDSIAANGIRFTDGYVSCPVCSPTRAGLMTGRYQQRFGHEFNPGPVVSADVAVGLPLSEKTLPEYLKELGYTTGMVGKWHLGTAPRFLPTRRGFDEFFGFLGGAHSYVDAGTEGTNPILRGVTRVNEEDYLTDAFAREAATFIDGHADERFFLYLAFNAVHTPMQATGTYLARFETIQSGKRRTLAAMLSAMDDAVGAVLEKLREAHIEDDTLIFFISDNGGPTQANASSNLPLNGVKGQLLEGGIRVPLILQWKRRLPAGKVYGEPVISLDILPTVVAAAGGTIPEDAGLDGVNLLPFLQGEQGGAPHETLYWRHGKSMAIRRASDKLLIQPEKPAQLFDLDADIGEKHDLAADEPQKTAELKAALETWDATLAEPLWQRKPRPRATRPQQEQRGRPRQRPARGRTGTAE